MSIEVKRQLVHVLLFIFAFLLKFLDRWQVSFILLSLFLAALFFVPKVKIKKHLFRKSEVKYSKGGVFYFLTLFILSLVFPLTIVAASWVVLSLGDGMATLLGKSFGKMKLFWNEKKTYIGLVSFMVFSFIGCFVILKWMVPSYNTYFLLVVSLKVSIFTAFVESLKIRIDDNILVPTTVAFMLYLMLPI